MTERYDAKSVANQTMLTLKDFQRATVNRVISLYEQGCDRVLVADEVGLGKTVVARGVIARFAELREREGDDLVKIVYICSNQNIASQNVQKLRVSEMVFPDLDMTETRLSMQHLRIAEQESDPKIRRGYVQIIPLTPETSFRMTSGLGLRRERALIYVILERMLKDGGVSLSRLRAQLYAAQSGGRLEKHDEWWSKSLADFRKRVAECERNSGGKYPNNLIGSLEKRGVRQIAEKLATGPVVRNNDPNIRQLRQIFAEESAAMLNPDLVIMDEFQRFRFLISSDADSETRILAERFLLRHTDDILEKIRVLLLSATPYKLYSTAAEISESGQDDEYKEFIELIEFLFEGRHENACEVWCDYTKVLREHSVGSSVVLEFKQRAEDVLSRGICRTERISVMNDGDFISDANAKKDIEIAAGDISSYIEFSRMLKKTGVGIHLPIDYVKSCPYLMSYLRGYQIKEKIERSFKGAQKHCVEFARGRHLWLTRGEVEEFRALPKVNARLEALKAHAFEGNAALYMWLPPSLPYYQMRGAYRNAKEFSKVLVFSSWEMVPRMIATLLSYEAERRTVAHVQKRYSKKHSPRLRETVDKQPTAAYEALVEPERIEWLVGLWNPIETLNAGMDLPSIERSIREKVCADLGPVGEDTLEVLVNKVLGSPAVCIARRIGVANWDDQAKELAHVFWDRFNAAIGTAVVEKSYGRKRDDAFHWQNVLQYCKDGCFQAMFDEYYAVVRDDVSFSSGKNLVSEIIRRMKDALTLRIASYDVDTYPALHDRVYGKGNKGLEISMRTHYAVGFAKGKGEEAAGIGRKDSLRKSFNSPMRPFVLASTSIGQEGLDFHPYCRKIYHWNLPSNPIDLEQREGRINRYKCLAVRENAALKYGKRRYEKDVWAELYEAAEVGERQDDLPQLVPFWCFGRDQAVKIERIVPRYPCSRDEAAYDRLIKILSIYRLSMGQPRQEELLEHVLKQYPASYIKDLKKYFINLSPYMREHPSGAPILRAE